MQLVFLALEVREEAADAPELAVAVDDEALLVGRQVVPGHVERNAGCARIAAHLGGERAVLRLGPRLDGAFGQGQRLVRDDEVQVEVDGVAEALAARAGPVGIVEGEEARLGLVVARCGRCCIRSAARTAGVVGRFAVARSRLEIDFAGFAVADLDGVDDACADVGRDDEAVDQDEDGLGEVRGRAAIPGWRIRQIGPFW